MVSKNLLGKKNWIINTMQFVSCQCSAKYSLSVLKCILTATYDFIFPYSSPYLVNQSGRFKFETNEPNLGMCTVRAMTQLNVWPRLRGTKSTLVFSEKFRYLRPLQSRL